MATIKVRSKGFPFRSVSGRVGDFVFRSQADETMLVFYQPKGAKGEKDLSGTAREWVENGSIMARFEELANMFNLEVVQ